MASEEEEILARLREFTERYGGSLEKNREALNDMGTGMKSTTMNYKQMGSVLGRLKESIEETKKTNDSEYKALRKEAANKKRQARAQGISVSESNRLIAEGNELKEQANMLQDRLNDASKDYIKGARSFAAATAIISVVKVGAEYAMGSAKMASSLISSVQAQSDSVAAATDLLKLELQRTVSMTQAGLDGLNQLGSIAGPVGQAIAGTLTSAGQAALEGYRFLSEEGIEKLGIELTKTKEQLVNMSNAGAFFAQGMGGLRAAAQSTGLRLEDYSTIIRNAGNDLRTFGASQVDALNRVQNVIALMDKTVGKDTSMMLRRLGYSVTDISELTTEYMANLARTGTLAGMSQEKLAQGSFEYMTNLKVISAITGEEAKAAQERARSASTQSAVFAKLSSMGGEATAQFQAIVKMMPGFEKELQQILLTGQTDNAAFINSPAFKIAQEALGKLGSNASDIDIATGLQNSLANARLEMDNYIRELSAAGLGALYGQNSQFSDSLQGIVSLREQSLRSAEQVRKDIESQSNTTNELTNRTFGLQENFEKISVVIEGRLNDGLNGFAGQLEEVTARSAEYADLLMEAMLALRPEVETSFFDKLFGAQSVKVSEKEAAANVASTFSNKGPALTDAQLDQLKKGIVPPELGGTPSQGSYAKGGVVVGPTSGYRPDIVMHGKEAIVPLGDGGVPVVSPVMEQLIERIDEDLRTRGTTVNFDVSGLINKLNEVNETSKMQVEMSKRIVERLETANSVSKQIMQLTR